MRTSIFRIRARHWCAIASLALIAGHTIDAQQANAPAMAKLTTVLADLVRSAPAAAGRTARQLSASTPKSAQDAMRSRRLRIDDNDNVQVYVLVSRVDDSVTRQLTASGATIELADAGRRRIQARIPVSRLLTVAQLPVVDAIRLPTYARHRTGNVTSEGDAIMQAAAARANWPLDGTGVRIGVISDGLKGVFATGCTTTCGGATNGPMTTGDLPTATGVRNANGVLVSSNGGIVGRSFQANGDLEGLPPATPACGFAGAGAEGTALLEIVHDLAPGAKLAFANGDTDLEFAQAVSFLAASNDIVLDDIGFFGEADDGTSGVSTNTAAALNNPANPIRAYFTSVGNDADEHYLGQYVDSGVDGTTVGGITTAGHLHLFQSGTDTTDVLGLGARPYNVIALPQNGEAAIFLTWDDPFGGSRNNYDLYLVQDSTGQVVARSTDVQAGSQDPVEVIDYVNPGAADRFRIVVQNVGNAAQPKTLNIFTFQPECATAGPQALAAPAHERHNYNTAARSVSAQADAGGSPVSVISVGAVCSASSNAASQFSGNAPDQSCLDTSNSTAEFFSSRGPTLDGRTKPDVAGIDGVSVTGAGGFATPFFGTSAATPHMGAIAALFLQGAPCLLSRSGSSIDANSARATVRNVLLSSAVPLGRAASDPPNNTFGFGLGNAVGAVVTTFAGAPSTTTFVRDGNTPFGAVLTASQLGFSDPYNCPLVALSWSGGCGTGPGAQMTCPPGVNNVAVRASNNGTAFSAEADLQITVTSFSMTASPASATAASGQPATVLLTLAPQGGVFNTPIALSCSNLPAQATCAFNPPTVTLGASTVQSTLTISTGGATATSAVRRRRGWLGSTPSAGNAGRLGAVALLTAIGLWLAAVSARRFGAGARVLRWTSALILIVGVSAAIPRSTVRAQAGVAIFPDTITFGAQAIGTTSAPQVAAITNIGSSTLVFAGVTTSGDFGMSSACGGNLTPGASCFVAITFTPTAAGARTGQLAFTDSATGSPHTVTLNGTGNPAPSGGAAAAGSYTVTVNATAGSFVQAAPITLTVQ